MMKVQRLRMIVAAIWLFALLCIVIGLPLSWTTGTILFAVSLVPPIALFGLWNQAEPLFHKASRDPRSS